MLPLAVEAIADIMVKHDSTAVSQIHLDYIQRPLHRRGTLTFERGWLTYDLIGQEVIARRNCDAAPVTVWSNPDYDLNESYVQMLELFLRYGREGRVRHAFDAWRATEDIAVVDAARLSSAEMRFMKVER
jgi:hypothetical protein